MSALYGSQPHASDYGSVLGSAGTGAALGSVIPGLGTGAGAAVGLTLGLLNAIFGASSQSSANKANLQIARETNDLNYLMFQEQQKFAWDMWKSTNKYNTPAHQRELMQAAGFNPNMLFGYNQGAASNINSPTPNGAQPGNAMQAAYRPEFAEGAVNASAGLTAALSESRLKDAQAAGQRIDNLYNAREKEASLLLKGDQHTAQAIQNEVEFATKEDKKRTVALTNQKTEADTKKVLSEQALNKIMEKYHDAKIDEVREAIRLLIEEQNETAARAKMHSALGSKYLAEKELTDVQRHLAPGIAASQMAANYGSAHQAHTQAELNEKVGQYQDMVNTVYKVFGKGKAAQDFLNSIYQGSLMDWQAEDFAEAAREKKIFNKYEETHKWIRNAKDIMSFVKDFFGMFSSSPPGTPTPGR